MEATAIVDVLARELPELQGQLEAVASLDGMPTLYVPCARVADACRVLRDAPELAFAVFVDLIAVDYHPREPRYELVYLLLCPGGPGFGTSPKRLRVKIRVPGADAHAPTTSLVWIAANWAEREVYDLFGIRFDGHPDLRRILMPDDWEGFPLRKDYPVQIREPVKTYAPLQVSEEEFVAQVEESRSRSRKKRKS